MPSTSIIRLYLIKNMSTKNTFAIDIRSEPHSVLPSPEAGKEVLEPQGPYGAVSGAIPEGQDALLDRGVPVVVPAVVLAVLGGAGHPAPAQAGQSAEAGAHHGLPLPQAPTGLHVAHDLPPLGPHQLGEDGIDKVRRDGPPRALDLQHPPVQACVVADGEDERLRCYGVGGRGEGDAAPRDEQVHPRQAHPLAAGRDRTWDGSGISGGAGVGRGASDRERRRGAFPAARPLCRGEGNFDGVPGVLDGSRLDLPPSGPIWRLCPSVLVLALARPASLPPASASSPPPLSPTRPCEWYGGGRIPPAPSVRMSCASTAASTRAAT